MMEWVPIVFLTFKAVVLFTGMFLAIKWHYDQDRKKKTEAAGPQSPTDMSLFVTMLVALALSLIGVVYAGCWGNAADGGRGGAFGLAFTFFMLCMSRSATEAGLTDGLAAPYPAAPGDGFEQIARLKIQTEQLRAAFAVRLASMEREKIYLSVASVISALAWKFGDIAAAWLKF